MRIIFEKLNKKKTILNTLLLQHDILWLDSNRWLSSAYVEKP